MRAVFVAVLATSFCLPAFGDVIPLNEGDVYCIDYDPKTESCASVQTLKKLGDGNYLLLDLSGFVFGENNLDLTSTIEAVEKDGKLCVVEEGITVSVTPKDNKLAQGWQNLMQYQLNEMAAGGYCFEHKKCDGGWVAIGWLEGKPRHDMSATFEIFSADDPRAKTVQPRYLTVEEASSMQKRVEDQCFPTDT